MTKKKIDLRELESYSAMDFEVGSVGTCSCGGKKFEVVDEFYEKSKINPAQSYEEQVCKNCQETVAMELIETFEDGQ